MQITDTPGHPTTVSLLSGMRVLDLTDGKGELCGRYLADLGADVILVEPPGGAAARTATPMHGDVSLYFASRNANKRGITLDLESAAGREALLRLAQDADVVIESGLPGRNAARGLGAADLHARNPALVVASITDFGQDGPYSAYIGTNLVVTALSATLDRSGNPGREPIPPPGRLVYETAAIQVAWAIMLAYANAASTGVGDHIDASLFELACSVFDPGFGVSGSARSTLSADADAKRGRPDSSHLYPVMPCADGHIRFALLAPRQWRGMWHLIGEPARWADPKYDTILNRFAEWDELRADIQAYVIDKPKADLVEAAKPLRIPLTDLRTPTEVLVTDHFVAREAFADLLVAPGVTGRMANGFLLVDDVRAGLRHPAPSIGEHNAEVLGEGFKPRALDAVDPLTHDAARPLAGLKVLDLGVIVMGAELPRLFADMGADVVKVENKEYPDGMRQVPPGELITPSFVWGSRNKRSLGLNLRDPRGAEIFKRLAADADIVMSNFKPGTMESLGLGYDVLSEINPRIVVGDSSALGKTGPWSDRMGYGPLVRASTGLANQWRYPGPDGGFCDTNTVYPDHAAARVEAVALLAAVIKARRTGRGCEVSVAQAESIFNHLPEQYLRESLSPGSLGPRGNDAEFEVPCGAYPCLGDDEWCAIEVRGDDDWTLLAGVIGAPELAEDARFATSAARVLHRDEVNALVTRWTSERGPWQAMDDLQAAGVPAGAMVRVPELPENPHLVARGFYRRIDQPQLPEPIPTESGPARFDVIADPPLRPAPLQGEDTREVLHDWLAMDDATIDELASGGVVEIREPGRGRARTP
jgi:crotonobetainyl-CoA:carnitine CoA-transferase CaiB-like acyl-CoA transferase